MKVGGNERALVVFANYFSQKGHKVLFLSCIAGNHFQTLDDDVSFKEPNYPKSKGLLSKIFYYSNLVLFIRRNVTSFKPDCTLSLGDSFNPIVLFSLLGTKIPRYVGDTTIPHFPFKKIIKFGKRFLYPTSAGFIAQTKVAAEFNRRKFKDRLNIKVINGAVKHVNVYDIPKKELIVCVGRLYPEKGQDRLLEAFRKLPNRQNWQLGFTGTGPLLNILKERAKEFNIEDSVHFYGNIDEVDYLLSEASIFVLPSRMEGFPNALCEAMAAGLPCICYDSFPASELITNGVDGIILKDGDIEALNNNIQRLIDSPEERAMLGKKASEVRERLHVNKIGDQFLNFMFDVKN